MQGDTKNALQLFVQTSSPVPRICPWRRTICVTGDSSAGVQVKLHFQHGIMSPDC